uniref:Uncharacterized protein n=1 Tax=Plectus sambesii TaxID=2011161 RepID=A0A914VNS2_9BILA
MTTEVKREDQSAVIDVEKLLRNYGRKKSVDAKQVQIDEAMLRELTEKLRKENKRKDRCLERIGILLLVLFFLGLTIGAEHLNAATSKNDAPVNSTTPFTDAPTSAAQIATVPSPPKDGSNAEQASRLKFNRRAE